MEAPTVNPEHSIDPEILERIGDLDFLTHGDVINIVLMYHERKPASIVELPYGISEDEAKADADEWQRSSREVEEILAALSLPFVPFHDDEFPDYPPSHYYVCKDQEHLDRLLEFRKKYDPEGIGLALGYPKTATEADAKGTRLPVEQVPDELRKSDEFKLLNFRLSADHWQEEMEQVRQNAQFIQKHYPSFYQKIVSE